MKWGGLSDDEAFALVTINPAKQLRIDNRVGSLEAGKDADVVDLGHHPLSSYAIVERTYIDGIAYYDRMAEERRLSELRKEKDDARQRREAGPATRRRRPRRRSRRSPETRRPRGRRTTRGSNGSNGSNGNGNGRARRAPWHHGHGEHPEHRAPRGCRRGVGDHERTIHPVTKPVIERGTIVIRGTKIEAVGANVSRPGRAPKPSTSAARMSIPASSTRGRRSDWPSLDLAGSTTSARCSTSIPSFAPSSRIRRTATRSRSRAPTASRRSR